MFRHAFQTAPGGYPPGLSLRLSPECSDPIETALEDLRQASDDLAFAEAAEMIARHRISSLDEMIAGCEADAEVVDPETAQALLAAAEGLSEERDSLTGTLAIELAFRADQRDAASARIRSAQRRLRSILQMPERFEALFASDMDRELAIARARDALRFDAETIAGAARQEARARLSDGLAAWPVAATAGGAEDFTQSAAEIARHMVKDLHARDC